MLRMTFFSSGVVTVLRIADTCQNGLPWQRI